SSEAAGINNTGQVIGNSDGRPFLYSQGNMTELVTSGASFTSVAGINDAGQIIGTGNSSADPNTHSFIYANGVMTDIGALNAYQNTVAKAINALGQVAGHSFNRNDGRAFLYSNGGMASLGAFDNGLYS